MVTCVEEHVAESEAHLFGRPQKAHMIPVGQDRAASVGNAVNGTSNARADRHHSTSERLAILRFDDEMGVIALQGIVYEAESGARATLGKCALDLPRDSHRAE